jgi:hypothetical protein
MAVHYGSHDMICSLAAALGVYDAHNGFVPPNRSHPIAQKKDDEYYFGRIDG